MRVAYCALRNYGLTDRLAVGEIGNMAMIIEEMGKAGKVITV